MCKRAATSLQANPGIGERKLEVTELFVPLSAEFIHAFSLATFNTSSAFDNLANEFGIESFTTTATTLNDSFNQFNFAFAGSQVAAHKIDKVRLTGLSTENFGAPMGFKFRTAGGSGIALNMDLIPPLVPGPLAGDFFVLDV